MTPVYATPEDLAEWLPGAPTGTVAERLLERASRDVYQATKTAFYEADESGMPTDPGILDALRTATLEQAAWRLARGDAGGAGAWDQVAIGSARLARRAGATAPGERAAGGGTLGADALSVLQSAGLVGTGPIIC